MVSSASPISDAAPGEALSAGIAGVSAETARQCWAEESPHELVQPGAYEWWYFHAISPAGDGIVLSLFEGLPFHPKYLTQINRYAHRLGTAQKPWPGLEASRYPAAYLAVYESGRRGSQFLNLYPPDSSVGTAGDTSSAAEETLPMSEVSAVNASSGVLSLTTGSLATGSLTTGSLIIGGF